jgi:hypothetical protein
MRLLTVWAQTDARAHKRGDTLQRARRFRIDQGGGLFREWTGEGMTVTVCTATGCVGYTGHQTGEGQQTSTEQSMVTTRLNRSGGMRGVIAHLVSCWTDTSVLPFRRCFSSTHFSCDLPMILVPVCVP